MAITARLARAWTAGAVICLILLGSATGALGAQAGAAALRVSRSVPHPGRSSGLTGLSCPSRRSCWAVGSYANRAGATLNQALHWNGARWSLVPVPNPGGTARNDVSELAGISCASPADCRAVGNYTTHNGFTTLNQALHWNGRRWSLVATPDPGGTGLRDFSGLSGASCALPGDCWAVGDYEPNGQASLNQALHWNGTRWLSMSIPSPGGTGAPQNTLSGVTCISARSCWAVGFYGTGVGPGTSLNLNQALSWNGRKWSVVATPDPAGASDANNTLAGVACAASADCWAVGWYGPVEGGKPAMLNQALHWNGRRWSLVPTPDPDRSLLPSNNLTAVRCTSLASCWAVGDFGTPVNQALHWNGTRWSPG